MVFRPVVREAHLGQTGEWRGSRRGPPSLTDWVGSRRRPPRQGQPARRRERRIGIGAAPRTWHGTKFGDIHRRMCGTYVLGGDTILISSAGLGAWESWGGLGVKP